MNPYNFALLFFSFCTLLISLLIWLKRQDTIGKKYLIFSLFVTVWGVGVSIMISENVSYDTALIACRISNTSAIFIPPTWLHFVLIFTNSRKLRKVLKVAYLSSFLLLPFTFTRLFITGVQPVSQFNYFGAIGPIYHIFTAMFFTIIPFSFFILINHLRDVPDAEKLRLKGFIIATAFGFLGGAMTFPPVYGIDIPQFGLFLMPIYPFIMAYFMIRKQLFNMEELAQAAHRDKLAAIGTLAASINHEVRNPLYVVQGYAQSYLANLKDGIYKDPAMAVEKASEAFTKTIDQTQRAMDIVKRFSSFAKQETHKAPHVETVHLRKVLEDILPFVRYELEADQVRLEMNLPAGLPPVTADRRHMEEIFFNLIVNAYQALKSQASGVIRIEGSRKPDVVQIEIADNGPGLTPEQMKHVFEPFYTTKEEGTGLGLYITKQLVEQNGGSISVESGANQGCRFILEFK